MDIIIAEAEKLPNIKGYAGYVCFYSDNTYLSQYGALFVSDIAFTTNVAYGTSNGARAINIDASKTPSTGYIYKDNAHVTPNCVVIRYWERFQ